MNSAAPTVTVVVVHAATAPWSAVLVGWAIGGVVVFAMGAAYGLVGRRRQR